jgi:hypothetical protein
VIIDQKNDGIAVRLAQSSQRFCGVLVLQAKDAQEIS